MAKQSNYRGCVPENVFTLNLLCSRVNCVPNTFQPGRISSTGWHCRVQEHSSPVNVLHQLVCGAGGAPPGMRRVRTAAAAAMDAARFASEHVATSTPLLVTPHPTHTQTNSPEPLRCPSGSNPVRRFSRHTMILFGLQFAWWMATVIRPRISKPHRNEYRS